MPVRSLRQFLDIQNIPYRCYNHVPTYTAQEEAHVMHISGHEVAKSVLLRVDDRLVLAVLPACEKVDLYRFKEMCGAVWNVELADEAEMQKLAPLCDAGSLPPIGNLFGLPVYVSTTLARDEVIAFNAGSHTEDIVMFYRDFEYLVQPHIMDFTVH